MTALSGSGVAYLAQFFDVFKRCGIEHGLSEVEAEHTVLATVESVLEIYRQTDLSLDEIIRGVASEGGTTEAGLKTMRERGLEDAIYQGLEHTISKCEDLSLR
jgi:pyrroline-5-carboxylate reductase